MADLEIQCPVCLYPYGSSEVTCVYSLNCGHLVCRGCLASIIQTFRESKDDMHWSPRCPSCRADITHPHRLVLGSDPVDDSDRTIRSFFDADNDSLMDWESFLCSPRHAETILHLLGAARDAEAIQIKSNPYREYFPEMRTADVACAGIERGFLDMGDWIRLPLPVRFSKKVLGAALTKFLSLHHVPDQYKTQDLFAHIIRRYERVQFYPLLEEKNRDHDINLIAMENEAQMYFHLLPLRLYVEDRKAFFEILKVLPLPVFITYSDHPLIQGISSNMYERLLRNKQESNYYLYVPINKRTQRLTNDFLYYCIADKLYRLNVISLDIFSKLAGDFHFFQDIQHIHDIESRAKALRTMERWIKTDYFRDEMRKDGIEISQKLKGLLLQDIRKIRKNGFQKRQNTLTIQQLIESLVEGGEWAIDDEIPPFHLSLDSNITPELSRLSPSPSDQVVPVQGLTWHTVPINDGGSQNALIETIFQLVNRLRPSL